MKKVIFSVFLFLGLLSQACTQGASGNTKANTAWSCNRAGCSNTGGSGGNEGAGNNTSPSNEIITAPSGNHAFPTSSSYGEDISVPLLDDPYQNEAITYALKYGPTGFSVSPSGLVTWDSRDFMFDEKMDFNWGIDINYKNQIFSYSGKITISDSNRKYPLTIGGIVVPRQEKSVVVEDFDHNGKNEILLTDNRDTVQIIEHNPNIGRYEVTWQYPYPLSLDSDPQIYSISTIDINNDSYKDFIIVSYVNYQSGTKFTIIDGLTRKKIQEFADGRWYIGCEASNLSGVSATNHLICLSESRTYNPLRKLYILELPSFNTIWASPDVDHGAQFQIGNIDADPQNEIVTSSGHIYDGISFANEFTYSPGFGRGLIRIGNVSGDAKKEIIFPSGYDAQTIKVFDGFTKQIIGTIVDQTNSNKSWIMLGNLDSDGYDEIISISVQNFGEISAFDDLAAGGLQIWNPTRATFYDAPRLYPLLVGDIDNDGDNEFLVAENVDTSNSVNSGLISLTTNSAIPAIKFRFDGREKWDPRLDQISGGYWASNGSTNNLLFIINSGWQPYSQYIGARFAYLHPSTSRYSFSNELPYFVSSLSVAEIHGDGIDDVFFMGPKAAPTQDPTYILYQSASNNSQQMTSLTGTITSEILSEDLNNDGHLDFLFVNSTLGAVAYDAIHKSIIWFSGTSQGNISDIFAADIDGDGKKEILVLSNAKVTVFEYSGVSYQAKFTWSNTQLFSRIFAADLNNDGGAEIILVSYWGAQAHVFSGNMEILKNTINLNNENLTSYYVNSVSVDKSAPYNKGILVASSNGSAGPTPRSIIKYFSLDSGKEIWRTGLISGSVAKNSMRFADIEGNGNLRLTYATSRSINVTR